MANTQFYGTGRRKTSTARVFLMPGKGDIVVNDKPLDRFFGRKTAQMIVRQPLDVTNLGEAFDIKVTVSGGGTTGQAGAIRHGLTRALMAYDEALRTNLRRAGFVTRDAREVERKKVGRGADTLGGKHVGALRANALQILDAFAEQGDGHGAKIRAAASGLLVEGRAFRDADRTFPPEKSDPGLGFEYSDGHGHAATLLFPDRDIRRVEVLVEGRSRLGQNVKQPSLPVVDVEPEPPWPHVDNIKTGSRHSRTHRQHGRRVRIALHELAHAGQHRGVESEKAQGVGAGRRGRPRFRGRGAAADAGRAGRDPGADVRRCGRLIGARGRALTTRRCARRCARWRDRPSRG